MVGHLQVEVKLHSTKISSNTAYYHLVDTISIMDSQIFLPTTVKNSLRTISYQCSLSQNCIFGIVYVVQKIRVNVSMYGQCLYQRQRCTIMRSVSLRFLPPPEVPEVGCIREQDRATIGVCAFSCNYTPFALDRRRCKRQQRQDPRASTLKWGRFLFAEKHELYA